MAKLLIIEDDESQRLLYEEELQEEGYEVVLAKSGKEALMCLEGSLLIKATLRTTGVSP